ncbi:MAG: hypothetical protein ACQEQN_01715, partial [Thermodesulfobacteriota bacterium]
GVIVDRSWRSEAKHPALVLIAGCCETSRRAIPIAHSRQGEQPLPPKKIEPFLYFFIYSAGTDKKVSFAGFVTYQRGSGFYPYRPLNSKNMGQVYNACFNTCEAIPGARKTDAPVSR